MEQNLPIIVKKVWSLVRVFYFMLRKEISKRKLLLDLNMMIKRGKVVGKVLQNIMFHRRHHHHNRTMFYTNRHSHDSHHLSFSSPSPSESEFSCTTSPVASTYPFSPVSRKPEEDLNMMAVNIAVLKAMEMINYSEPTSPALPGFRRSPMVRKLIRVTDSPFPLGSVDEDRHVDEAAEQFISRFYSDLRLQNTKAAFGSA